MNELDSHLQYEFGSYRVDTLKRRLLHNEIPVQLTSKAFDTLAVLVTHAGSKVSKAELMDFVWPETAVEENNLTQQISALRKVFGERAGDHRYIVTVPGRGYCFVASVRTRSAEREVTNASDDKLPERHSDRARPRVLSKLFDRASVFGYGLAAIYVLLIAVPSFFLHSRTGSGRERPRSIAILEFRSAGVGDELLGMGIRDTLRAKLGNLDDVTVRPVSPAMPSGDAVSAGRSMNVDVVLTGSIQRDDERIRVAVEMVDVTNERIVWGNTFDETFANTFELQDSIASAVVTALKKPRWSGALHRLTGHGRNRELASWTIAAPMLRSMRVEWRSFDLG